MQLTISTKLILVLLFFTKAPQLHLGVRFTIQTPNISSVHPTRSVNLNHFRSAFKSKADFRLDQKTSGIRNECDDVDEVQVVLTLTSHFHPSRRRDLVDGEFATFLIFG